MFDDSLMGMSTFSRKGQYSNEGEKLAKIKRCLVDNGQSDQATPTDGDLFIAVSAVYPYKCADILPMEISTNCLISGCASYQRELDIK
jgi:hypothetical protein